MFVKDPNADLLEEAESQNKGNASDIMTVSTVFMHSLSPCSKHSLSGNPVYLTHHDGRFKHSSKKAHDMKNWTQRRQMCSK